MRASDGSGELPVASYELFSDTEILGRIALERMLAGLSTRRYPAALEPVGARTEAAATARRSLRCHAGSSPRPRPRWPSCWPRICPRWTWSRSWSTGCTSASTPALSPWASTSTGSSTPLSLVEGSIENATLVTGLIVGLRERGLDVTRPILAVLDGSKALRRAVLDVFDRPVIGRCQPHKIRNVQDRLPDKLRSVVASRMRLTVLRLNMPPTLARTFRSSNAIESMISICRDHASNVKRWSDGQMALRWCAAGMVEAGKQFRRVNGHMHLSLRDTLTKVTETVGAT